MKSSKIWRIIWIVGLYAILLIILYLVVLYKVKWEHKDLNTYLYFYDCGRELCSSNNVISDYHSKILCKNAQCPYIDNIVDDILILKNIDNKSWLYNYIDGVVINTKYNSYRYIGKNMYVVSNENEKYGIIDNKGIVLVDLKYNYINEYKNDIISYKDKNLYGIVSVDGKYNIHPIYEDVVLINDKIFAGKLNNVYQIYSYDGTEINNENKYNYVYSYDDTIIVFKDKKIDILNSNLNSVLLMKIDGFYDYITEREKGSLDIYTDDEYIYFNVFINENEYTSYKYDIKNKKII